jgi:hypothetical protein
VKKCQIDEQVEVSLMSANNLVLEPRVEGGGRSEVTPVRKDLEKAGGRECQRRVDILLNIICARNTESTGQSKKDRRQEWQV